MRFKAKNILVVLMLLALTHVSHAEAPPSPAQLNIKPVYEHLLLPDSYAPKDFRIDSPSVAANPSDPPRKYAASQRFILEVPYPSMDGKISPSSNVDDWIVISISDMRVYPLIQDAKGYFAYTAHFRNASRSVEI